MLLAVAPSDVFDDFHFLFSVGGIVYVDVDVSMLHSLGVCLACDEMDVFFS